MTVMANKLSPSSPKGWKALTAHAIDPDEAIHWGCSGRGWHCCTDKVIPVRPYDLVRLRHALRRPAQEIVNDGLVTFVWDQAGSMWGYLAQVPYERTRKACIFYEEITNVRARQIRDEDPERFATLPDSVRRAGQSTAEGEWRVAGLCGAHLNRPEACRGFPFQRDPARERRAQESPVLQIFRCGTCSLSTPTTPHEVMLDNALEDYWRADDVFLEVCRYLNSRGLAQIRHEDYRPLPVEFETRAETWVSMYAPDTNEAVAARFPRQWDSPLDVAGDAALYRMLMELVLDRVDALVAESGIDPVDLGRRDTAPMARPDLAQLMEGERELLRIPVLQADAA